MNDLLAQIVGRTRADLDQRSAARPEAELEAALAGGRPPGRPLRSALRGPALAVVAEFKRRAPSAPALAATHDPATVAKGYEAAGAAAVSVLTEPHYFGGSLADLEAARAACRLAVLRKDFIVSRYQLLEAALAGADGVLLIVGAVTPAELRLLYGQALELGLEPLVEAYNRPELEQALALGAPLVGINNRNLRDLTVGLEHTFELLTVVPEGVTVVVESGLERPEQLHALAQAGADAVLIGTALMRTTNPGKALGELLRGVRAAA